jgi:hypothetical protein
MIDRTLRRDVHRLVEELVPPAPWLDDRVMNSIPERLPLARSGGRGLTSLGFTLAGVALATIGILLVGVLIGSHLPARAIPAPATHVAPSHDIGVVRYRNLVDADLRNIDSSFQKGCDTRQACARQLEGTKSATDALLRDISTTAAPSALAPYVDRLRAAARQFEAQLDGALYVIAQRGTDYVTASAAPSSYDLTLAVAAVDCWPATPIEGDHGVSCS